MIRKTSISLTDDLYRRANFAAAGRGLSTSELVRYALEAELDKTAASDPVVAAAFRAMKAEVL